MPPAIEAQKRTGMAMPEFGDDAEAVRAIEIDAGSAYLLSRPQAVGVEPTTFCNLRCRMCPQHGKWPGRDSRGHVSEEVFEAAAEFFPGADLFLVGIGELLLHPRFLPMLERAAREGRKVTLFTNATLLTREISERMVALGVGEVDVSVDACAPGLFRAIRGADLTAVLENVRGLVEARRRTGAAKPFISVSFTMMRRNLMEIAPVAELAAELGADEVAYGRLKCYGPDSAKFFEEEALDYAERAVEEQLRRAREAAATSGIRIRCVPDPALMLGKYVALTPLRTDCTEEELSFWTGEKASSGGDLERISLNAEKALTAIGVSRSEMVKVRAAIRARGGRPPLAELMSALAAPRESLLCDDAFRALFITQSGTVYPCCEAYQFGTLPLGSLKEEPLPDIWNGERARELRRWWHALRASLGADRSEHG